MRLAACNQDHLKGRDQAARQILPQSRRRVLHACNVSSKPSKCPKPLSQEAKSMRLSGRRARHTGFTLTELAIAIVVVGLAVVSLVSASGACTRATHGSRQLTQAVFLGARITSGV